MAAPKPRLAPVTTATASCKVPTGASLPFDLPCEPPEEQVYWQEKSVANYVHGAYRRQPRPPRKTTEHSAPIAPNNTLSADAQSVTIGEDIPTAPLTVQYIYVKCT